MEQRCEGKLELTQRALQRVRSAVRRDLGKTVLDTANKMTIMIDSKEDSLYREVYQEGKQEGELEGKEKAALNMLRKGMAAELISEITELSPERVAQLKQQLEAGK